MASEEEAEGSEDVAAEEEVEVPEDVVAEEDGGFTEQAAKVKRPAARVRSNFLFIGFLFSLVPIDSSVSLKGNQRETRGFLS